MRERVRARRRAMGAVLAGERHDLGDGVLEEHRGHPRGAHAADLLFVHQHADGGAGRYIVAQGQLGYKRGVGAHAVILAVADDHGTVEPQIAGAAGRHHLQLGGKEVLLVDTVLVGQKRQHMGLYRVFRGFRLAASPESEESAPPVRRVPHEPDSSVECPSD